MDQMTDKRCESSCPGVGKNYDITGKRNVNPCSSWKCAGSFSYLTNARKIYSSVLLNVDIPSMIATTEKISNATISIPITLRPCPRRIMLLSASTA